MTIAVSVAIMHHPKRAALLPPLVYSLEGTPATVVADVGSLGPWWTAKRAWAGIRRGATHQLVLQDDVLPMPGFMAALYTAIEAVPDEPLGLWLVRQGRLGAAITEAERRGESWVRLGDGVCGPAQVMPVDLVEDFLGFERKHVKPTCPNDDLRVGMWCIATGRTMWFPVPGIVRHSTVPSVYTSRTMAQRVDFEGEVPTVDGRRVAFPRPASPVAEMHYAGNYEQWLDDDARRVVTAYRRLHGRWQPERSDDTTLTV